MRPYQRQPISGKVLALSHAVPARSIAAAHQGRINGSSMSNDQSDSARILLTAGGIRSDQLRVAFASVLPEETISYELAPAPRQTRSFDPTVLVAIVGAAGTAIGALITGALQIAQTRRGTGIVIQGRDGTRVEAPSSVSDEQLSTLVRSAMIMSATHIHITRGSPSSPTLDSDSDV